MSFMQFVEASIYNIHGLLFVQQADDMPEMPPEAVTEEQYTDEHGHIVVKKVWLSTCIGLF